MEHFDAQKHKSFISEQARPIQTVFTQIFPEEQHQKMDNRKTETKTIVITEHSYLTYRLT